MCTTTEKFVHLLPNTIPNYWYNNEMMNLETYFRKFRSNIIGVDKMFSTVFGEQKIVYADWIASGRLYGPIEAILQNTFGPMVGNTHSEASETGTAMTNAYHLAHQIIKNHVNASENDIIITSGFGMTGVINKMQRILGLKIPEQAREYCNKDEYEVSYCKNIAEADRPVVFLTHVEHHSNHTSWLETIADVVVLEPDANLLVNPNILDSVIRKYANRNLKIGSFSACSNVTGIMPPYYKLAEIMHKHGGYCFVDFAASAPYVKIDMHPLNPMQRLDAIFFSPHKFLGGPGSSGVMVFNKKLYHNKIPDQPGGGTVNWTNRWGQYSYITDIEAREDGGTPGFMQAFRTALCIKLKEKMGVEKIKQREDELIAIAFKELRKINRLTILAGEEEDRLGVFSFYVDGIHHNLIVKLLNDRYGVQVRGGCSCAGTYGHFLLHVNISLSKEITNKIDQGDLSLKPGWVRLSLHPTMTNDELYFIIRAIHEIIENIDAWEKDYYYQPTTNEFLHKDQKTPKPQDFNEWFCL